MSNYNWTGNLATGASTTVTLPNMTGYAVGTHTFYAQSGLINNNPDGNTPNDGVTSNFTYTVPPACANAVPAPYSQDFNAAASLPTGWVNTSNWLFGATHGNTGNGIYKNLYSSVPTGQFNFVGIGPLATGDNLTFDYRLLNYVATGTYPANSPAAPTGWGNLQIQVSTNCGSTFTTIHTINDANHIVQKPFAKATVSLAAYAGQVIIIRVLGTRVAGDWWADFDNFNVGSATIPVELKSINAFAKENHNKIEWTTASEKDLKNFQVERSIDNQEWLSIGTTTAKGGSKETNYSLEDNQPALLSYYRLRTIETSGKEEVSKIIAVKRFDAKKLVLLNVAPIPTTTGISVDFSVSKEARIRLVLTNIVGQTVEAQTIKAEEGANKTFLNLSNLPNGTYILTVSDGETTAIKRIVKQ